MVVPAGLGVIAVVAVDISGMFVGEEGGQGVEEDHQGVQGGGVAGDGPFDPQEGGDLRAGHGC